MIRSLVAATVLFTFTVMTVHAAPQRVVFEGDQSEHKWALKELNPELPSDWTGYDYLVLEMKASSPQRFSLTFYSGSVVQRRQMQPMADVWIRAAVPLQYYRQPNRAGFDLASVGKVPRNSFWISTGGVYGPLNAVEAIGVSMISAVGQSDAGDPVGCAGQGRSGFRCAGQEAGGGRVRAVDSGGLAREGEEPGAGEEGVGRRGVRPEGGRFRVLQVRRLCEHEGQGHRLLPRGAGGREVVVRGSRRAPVLLDEFDGHGRGRRRCAAAGTGGLLQGAAAGGSGAATGTPSADGLLYVEPSAPARR